MTPREFSDTMANLCTAVDWFETESVRVLGPYTVRVEEFNAGHALRYRWREDQFMCLRSRREYHLNMLGAEIMNRALRDAFLSTPHRTVLVPGCMRAHTDDECRGIRTPEGIRCSGCTAECHVNRIRVMGLRNEFDVAIIPHATDLSRWAAQPGAAPQGVVGVACLPLLAEGGWELRRYGIPAQCVVLNQSGCRNHWGVDEGATQFDMREFKRVLVVSSSREPVAGEELKERVDQEK
jgi:hypothetical protein